MVSTVPRSSGDLVAGRLQEDTLAREASKPVHAARGSILGGDPASFPLNDGIARSIGTAAENEIDDILKLAIALVDPESNGVTLCNRSTDRCSRSLGGRARRQEWGTVPHHLEFRYHQRVLGWEIL